MWRLCLHMLSLVKGTAFVSSGSAYNWTTLYRFSIGHGIDAIIGNEVCYGAAINYFQGESMPKALKVKWALRVEQIKKDYIKQRLVITKLAKFFHRYGIKMLLLKGYGLSLNYPDPQLRPCGDVDIWLFKESMNERGTLKRVLAQKDADELLKRHFDVKIDNNRHHHTVFYIDGVMIENHYDFLNVHSHRSNRIVEARLQDLVQQNIEATKLDGVEIFLPSANFNALFLLHHTAAHFAADRIVTRHLLDWRYFVEHNWDKVHWDVLTKFAQMMNMHNFLGALNAICIKYWGLSPDFGLSIDVDSQLVERVAQEIIHPEFEELKPTNAGLVRSLSYMLRRWWTNRWKHRICYRDSLISTFFVQLWSHLLKPKSLWI